MQRDPYCPDAKPSVFTQSGLPGTEGGGRRAEDEGRRAGGGGGDGVDQRQQIAACHPIDDLAPGWPRGAEIR